MIKINDTEIKQYESDLKQFASRAFPFATKATINGAAFKARGFIQEEIREKMTARNRFTVQSIRVEQSKTLNVKRQAAVVGSIADYMADQEFGGTKSRKGKEGVPIATGYSAGQEGQRPRSRLPRKPNKLPNIRLRKNRRKGSSRKQRNLVAVLEAAQSGNKYVFLDMGRTVGIFRVLGGKRKPRVKMVWDMSRKSVTIPKTPTFAPGTARAEVLIPELYRDAIIFQLKRQNLFKQR